MLDAFDSQPGNRFSPDAHAADADTDSGDRVHLCCVDCRHRLTETALARAVHGRETFFVTNPAGFHFVLNTFRAAPGCALVGAAVHEHSWFAPRAWRIATCAGCGAHSGWHFSAHDTAAFFALINNRLVEESFE